MSADAVARVLQRLDELGGGADSPWPDRCAAHLSLDPLLTDEALADRFAVDAAAIARVRANVAAGHPPGRGINAYSAQETPPPVGRAAASRGPSQTLSDAHMRNGEKPQPPLAMPTFTVTAPDGTVHHAATYMEARCLRARTHGTVAVEP